MVETPGFIPPFIVIPNVMHLRIGKNWFDVLIGAAGPRRFESSTQCAEGFAS